MPQILFAGVEQLACMPVKRTLQRDDPQSNHSAILRLDVYHSHISDLVRE